MPRVLKSTLQARARRLGVKGFSKMTKPQLEKAIAAAQKKKKPTATRKKTTARKTTARKTAARKTTARRKPMGQKFPKGKQRTLLGQQSLPEFNPNTFIENLRETLSFEIIQDDISTIEDLEARIYDELNREVSMAGDAMAIIYKLKFFSWGTMATEFGDPQDIYQVAYLALQDLINEEGLFYELEDMLLQQ